MTADVKRAVRATRDRFRYRLSDSEIRNLALAWAGVASANAHKANLPRTLRWDYLERAKKRELQALSCLAAITWDILEELCFFAHLMLAREPEDFNWLVKTWRRVDVEGDVLGDVYMALIHD